jgi:formylglycine-generating enzyme required for sulfatase activity/proteasome lid subunit RPN8/RPN11
VVFRRSVLEAIHKHGEELPDLEVCGVLVGNVLHDDASPFLYVQACIRGEHADSRAAQVTFKAETWIHIHEQMEQYPEQRIVGWYHTHPDFGIFLSPADLYIHENFFNLAWQIAYVLDPVRSKDGMFLWRAGKTSNEAFLIEEDVAMGPKRIFKKRVSVSAHNRSAIASPPVRSCAMTWAAISSFRTWVAKRKGLLKGLLGVAVEEAVENIPGARLALKILAELDKYGVDRLTDTKATVPEVKDAGHAFTAEKLDQLNAWMELLTVSYAGLLDKLEAVTAPAGTESDEALTALVKQVLLERADWRRDFDGCVREVRQATLSLARIEDKIDRNFHEIHAVGLAVEELKALFVESPVLGDWARLRQAQPAAVAALLTAEAHFRAGRRAEGVAVLVGLARQRGAGSATLCHSLGLRFLGQGEIGPACRYLEQAGEAGQPSSPFTHTFTSLSTASLRGEHVPVWRSLPRGFVIERRYRVECEVGRGGMASVYRTIGIDRINRGQVVALKVPAPRLMADDSTCQRFVQEIEVSQRLSAARHPGMVQTHGYVRFDDPHTGQELYGLVLEFIDGLSLAQYLAQRKAQRKPLTPAEIRAVLKPVCQALEVAHTQDPPIFHRDIKPANIMLTRQGRAKLMDFGIARLLDESRATLTGTHQVVGSLYYMPPEFLDPNAKLDARCDVYLAGNLLLELLTFHPKGDPESRSDYPQAWLQLLADAMSPVRGQRPRTIHEFLKRLEDTGVPPEPAKSITNSIGMKLALIPAGKFLMGSPEDEDGHDKDEAQHEVAITQPFYLGVHAVTVGQFRAFVKAKGYQTEAERDGGGASGYNARTKNFESGNKEFSWKNPGWQQSDDHPVVNVTWNDAVAYCDWLSDQEGVKYRLPTEAEWEYSCRAGTTTRFYSGDKDDSLKGVANLADASFKQKYPDATWAVSWDDGYPFTAPVGRFKPNAFGLYDMHGNVWEWCADWYDENYYKESPSQDPPGPSAGAFRVFRGGSFDNAPRNCRAPSQARARRPRL